MRALPDIYGLTVERLEPLEGFQRRSAENLVASIERSKRQPFHRVLYALGIPGIGVRQRARARLPLRLDGPADERVAGGDRGGRGHRPRAGGPDPGDARRAAQPEADRGAARAPGSTWSRSAPRGRRRLPLDGQDASCSPGRCRGCRARRRPSGSRGRAARSPARCRARPTTWSRARTRARSSTRRSELDRPVIDEAELERLLGSG